jgi:hypothetical protein
MPGEQQAAHHNTHIYTPAGLVRLPRVFLEGTVFCALGGAARLLVAAASAMATGSAGESAK